MREVEGGREGWKEGERVREREGGRGRVREREREGGKARRSYSIL